MSTTGLVHGMSEFDDLCRGSQGYSTNMAELYVLCDKQTFHRHSISFKETLRRLKNKVKETIQELENQSSRKVIEFTIGKTFVKSRTNVTFNTMKATTWTLGGGINGRWQDYKKQNYDGLVVIGCIEKDTIPKNVKETNKSIKMNQQIYALALEQGLIQHFSLHKPDERLRNRSFDTGCLPATTYKGGIVYVAYKLEPKPGYSTEKQIKLKQSIADMHRTLSFGLSYLKGLEDDETGTDSENEKPVRVDYDSVASSIKQFKQSSEPRNVGDTNVNAMDDLGKHVPSGYNKNIASKKSVSPGMSATERKNTPPFSQTTQQKQKSILQNESNQNVLATNLIKKEPSLKFTANSNQNSLKQHSLLPTADLLNSILIKKEPVDNAEEPSSSLPSSLSEQHSATVRAATPTKRPAVKCVHIAPEEKKLILNSYIQQRIKSDFDTLAHTVYKQRHEELPQKIINHYENTLTHQDLTQRIKRFINACINGKREKEKDLEIKSLIAVVNTNKDLDGAPNT